MRSSGSLAHPAAGNRPWFNCFSGIACRDVCEAGAFPSLADAHYLLPLIQPIVVAGSLYLVGAVRAMLAGQEAAA